MPTTSNARERLCTEEPTARVMEALGAVASRTSTSPYRPPQVFGAAPSQPCASSPVKLDDASGFEVISQRLGNSEVDGVMLAETEGTAV